MTDLNENNPTPTHKSRKKFIVIGYIVVSIVSMIVSGCCVYAVLCSNDTVMEASVLGVFEYAGGDSIGVTFNIKNAGYHYDKLSCHDFALMIDGVPCSAYMINDEYKTDFSRPLYSQKNITITAIFTISLSQIEKPLIVYYKGRAINIGETVKYK